MVKFDEKKYEKALDDLAAQLHAMAVEDANDIGDAEEVQEVAYEYSGDMFAQLKAKIDELIDG